MDCLTETWLSGILFKILGKKDKKKYKKRIKRIISKTLTFTLKPKHNATLYLVPPFLLSFIIYSGKKVAGFDFPLTLSNYKVRAMKGMFEVTYPLDEKREVTVRKSFEETNGLDNSGDYTKYEKNELLPVGDGVNLNVRKNGDKIYVMYFAAESGVYSARCEEGMNDNEAIGIFNTIKEAETKYLNLIP